MVPARLQSSTLEWKWFAVGALAFLRHPTSIVGQVWRLFSLATAVLFGSLLLMAFVARQRRRRQSSAEANLSRRRTPCAPEAGRLKSSDGRRTSFEPIDTRALTIVPFMDEFSAC
jgi:hypothetical protein